jgi:hypothetical protein
MLEEQQGLRNVSVVANHFFKKYCCSRQQVGFVNVSRCSRQDFIFHKCTVEKYVA